MAPPINHNKTVALQAPEKQNYLVVELKLMKPDWRRGLKQIKQGLSWYYRLPVKWQMVWLFGLTLWFIFFLEETETILTEIVFYLSFLLAAPIAIKLWRSQHYVLRAVALIFGWPIMAVLLMPASDLSGEAPFIFFENLCLTFFACVAMISVDLLLLVVGRFILGQIRQWRHHPRQAVKRTGGYVYIGILIALVVVSGYSFKALQETNKRLERLEEALGGEAALNCTKDELTSKVAKSIVRVVGGYSEGSGVMVKDDGTIITNFHVIQGEPAPKVVLPDYTFRTAKILMADKDKDIAILKIDLKTPQFLPVTNSMMGLKPLAKVYSVGYPMGTDIAGDPTIQEGRFVALRQFEGSTLIHTDLSLQEGQSGGALTDGCGRLLGINQASLSGASFTISNQTILETWFTLLDAKDPLKDVSKIEFKPQESPLETVKAFYNYQKTRQLQEAYELLDPKKAAEVPYEDWVGGYMEVIDVEVVSVKADEKNPNVVSVKLVSKDLVGQEVVYKYFEGTWEVEKIDGVNRLTKHNLKEIPEPGGEWYYDPSPYPEE